MYWAYAGLLSLLLVGCVNTDNPLNEDADNDGVTLFDGDCDDNDATVGSQSEDADCDGVIATIDCDDENPDLGAVEFDQDCDGLPTGACADTNNGATDALGTGCDWYEENPHDCGSFQDGDFDSSVMCCACGGGKPSL